MTTGERKRREAGHVEKLGSLCEGEWHNGGCGEQGDCQQQKAAVQVEIRQQLD